LFGLSLKQSYEKAATSEKALPRQMIMLLFYLSVFFAVSIVNYTVSTAFYAVLRKRHFLIPKIRE